MIYLDWAATTPPDEKILRESLDGSLEDFGNPSSQHRRGKAARTLLEQCRSSLRESIFMSPGTTSQPGMLYFTGSGTEADQIPLLALLRSHGARRSTADAVPHLIVSAIEHDAVLAQATLMSKMGFELSLVNPEADGRVSPAKVAALLRPSTRMVAVMAVNNETGAVQDIRGISDAIRDAEVMQDREANQFDRATFTSSRSTEAGHAGGRRLLFHVDCIQALGKIPLDFLNARQVTSAAFSAHKLRGPRGVGALWSRSAPEPLAVGGGQEQGVRSGTENLFGALAFAACARHANQSLDLRMIEARRLEAILLEGLGAIPGALPVPASRVPADSRWSPWIVSAAFPGVGGEVMARALSDRGISVSTGSACSQAKSGRKKGRRVLEAMGIREELAFSAIRISFGATTTAGDITEFLSVADDLYRRLKT